MYASLSQQQPKKVAKWADASKHWLRAWITQGTINSVRSVILLLTIVVILPIGKPSEGSKLFFVYLSNTTLLPSNVIHTFGVLKPVNGCKLH
jgi:hypothetical protein